MQTVVSLEGLDRGDTPLVLAAGFFDGVHLGHRLVLQSAVEEARRCGGEAWALTFDRHPVSVLRPGSQPPLLTQLPQRLQLLAEVGVDGTLLLPFTRELAAREPEEFIEWLCGDGRKIAALFSGENWHFGAGGAGTPEMLSQLGRRCGFKAVALPALQHGGERISSSRIRQAIFAGKVEEAALMLGRPHEIIERVIRGRGMGRTLNMATANIRPTAEVLPPVGVYAVQTLLGSHVANGVASLGWRPTFADARPEHPELEVHLLDFAGDLYGATLRVSFVARLRDEIRFPDATALVHQVERDIAAAREIFARLSTAS